MKKLIFLLIPLLSGCSCILSQIPPQYIYATPTTCSAPVPDYHTKVVVTDNCKLSWFMQDPSPGVLLTPENSTMSVTIKAGDFAGNVKEIHFTITLLDTIKPVITIDPSLLRSNWDAVEKLYNTADKLLVDLLYLDTILREDGPSIPSQVGNSYFSGVNRRTYPVLNSSVSEGVKTWNLDGVEQVDSLVYKTKALVIRVPPEHAFTGNGKRTFTFE